MSDFDFPSSSQPLHNRDENFWVSYIHNLPDRFENEPYSLKLTGRGREFIQLGAQALLEEYLETNQSIDMDNVDKLFTTILDDVVNNPRVQFELREKEVVPFSVLVYVISISFQRASHVLGFCGKDIPADENR